MFKFMHAADIHLDSPLRGLERYDGTPVQEIRGATRRALENLVQTALDEEVAFLLIAGDLYDGDWRDYNTGLHFVAQMTRLREAGIRVFLIAGNHDAANRMTRSLRLPDNVTRFPASAPETAVLEEPGVAVHGQSFATADVRENLAQNYPAPVRGLFNIGLLHTCLDGREGHDPYAPCTVDGLRAKGYDYWALGHIHAREEVSADPPIVFPGNLQGRHIRETGPKGCLMVTVDGGLSVETEFRPLDVLRWERLRLDVGGFEDVDELLVTLAGRLGELRQRSDGLPLAVRVELAGACALHQRLLAERARWTNEIRSQAIDARGGTIWVEKVKIQTAPPGASGDGEPVMEGPIGELQDLIGELRADPARWERLDADFSDILRKLPAELQQAAQPGDASWLRSLLDEARPSRFCCGNCSERTAPREISPARSRGLRSLHRSESRPLRRHGGAARDLRPQRGREELGPAGGPSPPLRHPGPLGRQLRPSVQQAADRRRPAAQRRFGVGVHPPQRPPQDPPRRRRSDVARRGRTRATSGGRR